jgi:hypothetical protein
MSLASPKGILVKKLLLAICIFLAQPAYADEKFWGADFASTFGYPASTNTIPAAMVSAGAPNASAQQKAGSLGAGLFIGQWYSQNIGSEVGYNYLGGNIDGSWSAGHLRGTYNYAASAFHWAFLAGTQVGAGRIFGKVGLYSAKTKSEWAVSGGASSSAQDSSLGLMAGLGFDEDLNDGLSSRFGVDIYNAVKFHDVAKADPVEQMMYRVSVGLIYRYK